MTLAFASGSPRATDGVAARAAARAAVSRPRTAAAPRVEPHVDQARTFARAPSARTRLDDALFGLATTLLLVAVALPLPASLSLLA
jgi:hypothetical protein